MQKKVFLTFFEVFWREENFITTLTSPLIYKYAEGEVYKDLD